MSDLISRKALMEEIEELLKSPYAKDYKVKEAIEITRDLCVKQAPTAYDMEKVMKRLEELYVNVRDRYKVSGDLYNSGAVSAFDLAIQAVEAGSTAGRIGGEQ